jgi:hypothetical protein
LQSFNLTEQSYDKSSGRFSDRDEKTGRTTRHLQIAECVSLTLQGRDGRDLVRCSPTGGRWPAMAGQFMYPPEAPRKLVALANADALPLERLRVKSFPFNDLEACIDATAKMRGVELTVLTVS